MTAKKPGPGDPPKPQLASLVDLHYDDYDVRNRFYCWVQDEMERQKLDHKGLGERAGRGINWSGAFLRANNLNWRLVSMQEMARLLGFQLHVVIAADRKYETPDSIGMLNLNPSAKFIDEAARVDLGAHLQALREAHQVSRNAFAEMAGTYATPVKNLEQGDITMFSFLAVQRLFRVLSSPLSLSVSAAGSDVRVPLPPVAAGRGRKPERVPVSVAAAAAAMAPKPLKPLNEAPPPPPALQGRATPTPPPAHVMAAVAAAETPAAPAPAPLQDSDVPPPTVAVKPSRQAVEVEVVTTTPMGTLLDTEVNVVEANDRVLVWHSDMPKRVLSFRADQWRRYLRSQQP